MVGREHYVTRFLQVGDLAGRVEAACRLREYPYAGIGSLEGFGQLLHGNREAAGVKDDDVLFTAAAASLQGDKEERQEENGSSHFPPFISLTRLKKTLAMLFMAMSVSWVRLL